MKELYKDNYSSNVHWRYYLYNKAVFFSCLDELDSLQAKNDSIGLLNLVDTLLTNLENDYRSASSNSEFLLFMQYVNNSDSAKKYIKLYYDRTKAKLSNIKDSIVHGINVDDSHELREYYTKYKASVFFKEAWFFVTKYHVSDVFFNLFIDGNVFNKIYYPSAETIYLDRDMYMNAIINKDDAEAIIKNVLSKKIIEHDLLMTDQIFLQGLKGVVDEKYLITYNND